MGANFARAFLKGLIYYVTLLRKLMFSGTKKQKKPKEHLFCLDQSFRYLFKRPENDARSKIKVIIERCWGHEGL